MLQVDDFMERGDVIWYRFYYSVGLILGVIGIFFGLVVFVFFYKYVFFVWYFYFYLIVELEYKFFQYSVKSSLWVEEVDIYVVNVLWIKIFLYLYFIIVGNKLLYFMINSMCVELQFKKLGFYVFFQNGLNNIY